MKTDIKDVEKGDIVISTTGSWYRVVKSNDKKIGFKCIVSTEDGYDLKETSIKPLEQADTLVNSVEKIIPKDEAPFSTFEKINIGDVVVFEKGGDRFNCEICDKTDNDMVNFSRQTGKTVWYDWYDFIDRYHKTLNHISIQQKNKRENNMFKEEIFKSIQTGLVQASVDEAGEFLLDLFKDAMDDDGITELILSTPDGRQFAKSSTALVLMAACEYTDMIPYEEKVRKICAVTLQNGSRELAAPRIKMIRERIGKINFEEKFKNLPEPDKIESGELFDIKDQREKVKKEEQS